VQQGWCSPASLDDGGVCFSGLHAGALGGLLNLTAVGSHSGPELAHGTVILEPLTGLPALERVQLDRGMSDTTSLALRALAVIFLFVVTLLCSMATLTVFVRVQ
jgi:hypothetical protein